jgi:hypothetical protein
MNFEGCENLTSREKKSLAIYTVHKSLRLVEMSKRSSKPIGVEVVSGLAVRRHCSLLLGRKQISNADSVYSIFSEIVKYIRMGHWRAHLWKP